MTDVVSLLDVLYEDTINYKKISMTLEFPYCSFKCNKDAGKVVCHNFQARNNPIKKIKVDKVINRYLNNPIPDSIVMQGFEPMDSFDEVYSFINILRNKYHCDDDVVIYTGYTHNEILEKIKLLKQFKNVIIKFGRYIPDCPKHFDDVLGVSLASDNQYAMKIS